LTDYRLSDRFNQLIDWHGHNMALGNRISSQASRADTLERILDSAERLFAERGFHATSTRRIAAEAGISIQTLHYHSGSKLNLYHMVLERSVVPVTRMIDTHIQSMLAQDLNDDRVLEQHTDRIIDELFDVVGEHPNYAPLFLRQWLEKDTQLRKVEQEELVPRIGEWVSRVEELVGQERRGGIDLPLVLLSLSWVYWGMNASPGFIGPLLGIDPDSPEYQRRLREHAKAVTRRMLEARPSHAREKRGRS
jgi:AcrR family transcriptional regulator